ncbi:MAG: diaminopimelate decarboxylase [Gaiellales bacterium]
MSLLGSPWPDSAQVVDGSLVVGGRATDELAAEYGTPLYVYDASTLRARARAYTEPLALRRGGSLVAFATKACSTVAVLRLLASEGLGFDVSSEGELAAALAADADPERIVVHGNAKTDEDIEAAVAARCGLVVLDGPDEASRVALAAARHGLRQPVALRLTPGIDAGAHAAIRTGGNDSKFGFTPDSAELAIARVRSEPRLWLRGLHVHLGSQVVDGDELESAVTWLAGYCDRIGLDPELLDLGGGLGIAYEDELPPDPARHAEAISRAVERVFPQAMLVLEPGRSVTGPAGVTLYTVQSTKTAGDGTRYVAIDGGMSDNPRPQLYGARYTIAAASRMDDPPIETVDIAGRHCESGDVLTRGVSLPTMRRGDLVAVAATGAYSQSMASTYNSVPRAAAVIVEAGHSTLVTRRETVAELLAHDV